ncbi:cytochrome P460 [Aquimarina sp. MAR_2010_214]|uniref:heme-binding domain-containing protein n=1 Tax=Aquimarina sp. MAR_2010_214 TaxID=1250026 RepID=UPI000C70D49F|nr:heme-binding domain-containing protein [Aquimarina sp. MAR_2010_214]PKV50930.1 cytochrome P460 [Aquimarina sp. MAR_2010_214]
MKKIKFLILGLLVSFILIQFIKPDKFETYTAINENSEYNKLLTSVPDSIELIIKNSCYDCHSNQTNLQWFDKIIPINFVVDSHIKEGRKALNFSNFDSLNSKQVSAKLFYSLNKALSGEMPLPSYTLAHSKSKITNKELQQIKSYLLSISERKLTDSIQIVKNSIEYYQLLDKKIKQQVKPTLNGIEYIPDYQEWKAVSTTDRFDNRSMRVIYANDVAVKAIETGKINPWPNGTVFAKAAWAQQIDNNEIIRLGNFIQVEYMIKDTEKYASTDSWGWARWRGDELKPYGSDALFVNECITCHKPVEKYDYVFTAPLNLNVLNSSK